MPAGVVGDPLRGGPLPPYPIMEILSLPTIIRPAALLGEAGP